MKTQKTKNKRVKAKPEASTKIDKKPKDLSISQKAFLIAYKETVGNITESCTFAKIDRSTYYLWLKNERFKKAVESVEPKKMMDDLAVKSLVKLIKKGEPSIVKEYLNKRAKSIALWDEDKQEEQGTMIKVIIKGEEEESD